MIPVPSAARVYVAADPTDMRKGFDGLSALVQETLTNDPFKGSLIVSAGARLAQEGAVVGRAGFCLFAKRPNQGAVSLADSQGRRNNLASAQLARRDLLEAQTGLVRSTLLIEKLKIELARQARDLRRFVREAGADR